MDVRQFWNGRHAASDALRAGGDKGLSVEENYEFYAIRLGKLLELINRHHLGRRPLEVLDAGCGNGVIAGEVQRCGHCVFGVDFSAEAIERARQQWPEVRFEVAPLERVELGRLFDVVYCVDVLFHVVDDELWRRALVQLAKHCAADGSLIVTDTFTEESYAMGDYIVHRSRQRYVDVLTPLGFVVDELLPFGYGGNPNVFALCRRPGA